MTDQQPRTVTVPAGMPAYRARAPREAIIPDGEIPLIDKNQPKEQQLKEVWTVHARLFNLQDAEQLTEYNRVWQLITDGRGRLSKEEGPHFDPKAGNWTTFLRWAEFTYKV